MLQPKFCLECATRPICQIICLELEAILPKEYTGKRGKREKTFDPFLLDILFIQFDNCGRRKEPKFYDD
jgi:hypothetical protein